MPSLLGTGPGMHYKSLQESRAVAGNPRDAAVIFDPQIKNTINKDQWRTDVKLSYVNYLLNL